MLRHKHIEKFDFIEHPEWDVFLNKRFMFMRTYFFLNTVEPAYNYVGLYDTSPRDLDILWYQLNGHCWP
jgi:hypothetical protein